MMNPQATLREKHRKWRVGFDFPTSLVTPQMLEDHFMLSIPEQMMEMVEEYVTSSITPQNQNEVNYFIKDYIQWYQKKLGVK